MEIEEKNRVNSVDMIPKGKENGFSVEMRSLKDIEKLSFSEDKREVLIEGTLGELEELGTFEEEVLILEGTKGTLRVDITIEDIRKIVSKEEKNHG
jgi:hypothetical protein